MKKYQHQLIEKNIRQQRAELNYCTYSYVFAEYLQYLKRKFGNDYATISQKLESLGQTVGIRMYEIVSLRERTKRETKLLEQLRFVQSIYWKHLFGRSADSIERLKDRPGEYIIRDENPMLLKYVSEESPISPVEFYVGVLQGVFTASGFNCKVAYQFKHDERDVSLYPHTVFILSFDDVKEI